MGKGTSGILCPLTKNWTTCTSKYVLSHCRLLVLSCAGVSQHGFQSSEIRYGQLKFEAFYSMSCSQLDNTLVRAPDMASSTTLEQAIKRETRVS